MLMIILLLMLLPLRSKERTGQDSLLWAARSLRTTLFPIATQ